LIGALSPVQANQPWYPTLILPTTSPAAEVLAVAALAIPKAPAAAAALPPIAVVRTLRRDQICLRWDTDMAWYSVGEVRTLGSGDCRPSRSAADSVGGS